MWEVTQGEGKNGMATVTISKGSDYSVEIYLHGATITSWKHAGVERIFVSSIAVWNGIKAIRGGIPVVWPQFGQPDSSMPQHGFLRNSAWTVHDITTAGVDASVTFIIHSTPETLLLWPHPFRATYTVVISEQRLSCNFKSFNTGDTEFKCHALLHTYFSIPNIQEVAFNGYQGLSFADKTRENGTFQHSQEVPFEITQEVDRVYSPSCSDIPIPDITILHQPTDAPLMTIQKSAQIESQFSSFQTLPCDCVLWNPWVDKARALTDMDDEGYLSFVCVEPGVVSDYVTIPPGHALSLSQVLIPGGV